MQQNLSTMGFETEHLVGYELVNYSATICRRAAIRSSNANCRTLSVALQGCFAKTSTNKIITNSIFLLAFLSVFISGCNNSEKMVRIATPQVTFVKEAKSTIDPSPTVVLKLPSSNSAGTESANKLPPFIKLNNDVISWCGIYPGMIKNDALSVLGENSSATWEIISLDKSNKLDIHVENEIENELYDEYIQLKCFPSAHSLIALIKGKVYLIKILLNQYTVKDYINYFGDPEYFKANYYELPNNIQTSISYDFLKPSKGIAFSGSITKSGKLERKISPDYFIDSVYLVNPDDYKFLLKIFIPGFTDRSNMGSYQSGWNGYDAIIIN